jgi:hypothetical protein
LPDRHHDAVERHADLLAREFQLLQRGRADAGLRGEIGHGPGEIDHGADGTDDHVGREVSGQRRADLLHGALDGAERVVRLLDFRAQVGHVRAEPHDQRCDIHVTPLVLVAVDAASESLVRRAAS